MSEFGVALRKARQSHGITLRDVGSYIGTSHVHIHNVEIGKSKRLAERYWDQLRTLIPGFEPSAHADKTPTLAAMKLRAESAEARCIELAAEVSRLQAAVAELEGELEVSSALARYRK